MTLAVYGKIRCPKCESTYDISLEEFHSNGVPPGVPAGFQDAHAASNPVDELGELLDQIVDKGLEEKSLEFVHDMRARYLKYGQGTFISPKQKAWLKQLIKG